MLTSLQCMRSNLRQPYPPGRHIVILSQFKWTMAGRTWCKFPAVMHRSRQQACWEGQHVEDVFYKCQINHPVDAGCCLISSYISLPPSLSLLPASFQLQGFGAVTQTMCRGRQSGSLSLIDSRCQDVLLFFFSSSEVTNRKHNVREAAMNHAPPGFCAVTQLLL